MWLVVVAVVVVVVVVDDVVVVFVVAAMFTTERDTKYSFSKDQQKFEKKESTWCWLTHSIVPFTLAFAPFSTIALDGLTVKDPVF